MLCVSAKLWPHLDITARAPFFLDPEDFANQIPSAIWNFIKRIQPQWHKMWFKECKGPIKGLTASGPMGA
jgi:hypothetical protein